MSNVWYLIYLVMPVVLAGIVNMVFVKSPVFNQYKVPMDNRLVLKDGKRLFGDNKTWKGFFGMIIFTGITMAVFQLLAITSESINDISLFPYREWSFPAEGFFYGLILGLAYVLAELPNSYIKRRIDIQPGTNAAGLKGALFVVIDQADSVIGCVIFMLLFYTPSLIDAVMIIVLSTCLHLLVNFLLFLVGLKNQPA